MTKAQWGYIVEHHEENLTSPESKVESDWIDILKEFFGYSKIFGEIDVHRQLPSGTGHVIPDIIVRKNGKDLFCIELKQYNMKLTEDIENQLSSYLSLLHLSVGIIICQKIYVCIATPEELQKLEKLEIAFDADDAHGEKFIALFQKDGFSAEGVTAYVGNQIGFDTHVNEILEKLTDTFLINIAKDYFNNIYTEAEVEKALSEIKISVTKKQKTLPPSPPIVNPTEPIPSPPTGAELKRRAIRLFGRMGYGLIPKRTTFASKTGPDFYWANPSVTRPTLDWDIILYDDIRKTVRLFHVPARSVPSGALRQRADKPQVFDLRITYDDPMFKERYNNFCFHPFLTETVECDLSTLFCN